MQKKGFSLYLLPTTPRRPQRGWGGWRPRVLHTPTDPRCSVSPGPAGADLLSQRPPAVPETEMPQQLLAPSGEQEQGQAVPRGGMCQAWLPRAGQHRQPGQPVPRLLPAQAEPRPGWGVRENRKLQVWQGWGTAGSTVHQELELYAGDIGSLPPVPQTLAVAADPSPGQAQPTWPYPDTPGGCLFWPQPHVLTLCWLRSLTAPRGTWRISALHP